MKIKISSKRIHPPLEKTLSPQVDVFMITRFRYGQEGVFDKIELWELIPVKPFEMSAACLAMGNIFTGLVFFDFDIATARAAPINAEDFSTVFKYLEFALFFGCIFCHLSYLCLQNLFIKMWA